MLDEYQVVLHSPDSIAPVGVLHPSTFHLEKKGNPDSNSPEEESSLVSEVLGDGPNTSDSTRQRDNGIVDLGEHTSNRLHISKTEKHNTFSICCWLEDSSVSSTGNSKTDQIFNISSHMYWIFALSSLNRSERRSRDCSYRT